MYEIVESDGGYDLLEINRITPDDVSTWVLGHYDTEPEAERALAQWRARDMVDAQIDDFIDELIAEFSANLDDDEIRARVAEKARVTDFHKSSNQALRGQKNGIGEGVGT